MHPLTNWHEIIRLFRGFGYIQDSNMLYNNTDTVYKTSLIIDFNLKFQPIAPYIKRIEEHFYQTFTLNIIVSKTKKII